jgi:hypothetical protein
LRRKFTYRVRHDGVRRGDLLLHDGPSGSRRRRQRGRVRGDVRSIAGHEKVVDGHGLADGVSLSGLSRIEVAGGVNHGGSRHVDLDDLV